jgi:hypothetical protein
LHNFVIVQWKRNESMQLWKNCLIANDVKKLIDFDENLKTSMNGMLHGELSCHVIESKLS